MPNFDPFQCPAPATLTAIPDNACPEAWDQIVRLLFMRRQSAAPFTVTAGANSLLTKAKLVTYLAATDNTKAVLTPLCGGLVFPKAEPKFEGENDNLYPDGAGIQVPGDPILVRATFTNKKAATQTAMDKLMGEGDGLQVYLINRFGHFICKDDGFGFDCISVGVTDFGSDGLNKPNQFDVMMKFAYGWTRNSTIVKPTDYSGRTIVG